MSTARMSLGRDQCYEIEWERAKANQSAREMLKRQVEDHNEIKRLFRNRLDMLREKHRHLQSTEEQAQLDVTQTFREANEALAQSKAIIAAMVRQIKDLEDAQVRSTMVDSLIAGLIAEASISDNA